MVNVQEGLKCVVERLKVKRLPEITGRGGIKSEASEKKVYHI